MADNQDVSSAASYKVATDKVTYSSDADANVELGRPVHVEGAEGSKTVTAITLPEGMKVVLVDSTTNTPIAVSEGGALLVSTEGNVAQVMGMFAHDAAGAAGGAQPLLVGGYASAAAPTSVSADGDAVDAWYLRNGAAATVLTAAGALIGGDATNGIDVDVTRLSALVAGTAVIGKVGIDQTTPGTTNAVSAVLTAGSAAVGKLAANDGVDIGDVTVNNATGSGTATAALRVELPTNGTGVIATVGAVTAITNALPAGTNNVGDVDIVTLPNVSTATLSNVADAASSAQLLASNSSRKGCVIWNDSTEDLFIKYGTTASLTDCVHKIPADAQWTMVAPIYTGRIDGIWRNNASGSARITEL